MHSKPVKPDKPVVEWEVQGWNSIRLHGDARWFSFGIIWSLVRYVGQKVSEEKWAEQMCDVEESKGSACLHFVPKVPCFWEVEKAYTT